MLKSRKHKEAKSKVDRTVLYPVEAAIDLVKEVKYAKFDETVEIVVRLGVDPRKADQMVRGAVVLPNGLGKQVRVLVFAKGEKGQEASEAGADYVGGEDLVEKIKGGWFDFDATIATPDMMGVVGKIGRILGPKGMMPNPKTGTVTMDVAKAVQNAKAGQVNFRVDKKGNIHAGIGKASFSAASLKENAETLVKTLNRMKPAAAKGKYMKKAVMSLTMSPGIALDVNELMEMRG